MKWLAFVTSCLVYSLTIHASFANEPFQDITINVSDLAKAQWQFHCGDLMDNLNDDKIEMHELKDGKKLSFVTCQLAAYNVSALIFIVDENNYWDLQHGAYPDEQGLISSAYFAMPSFDSASQTISTFHKGRGLGDCGTSELYELVDNALILQEMRRKEECDGEAFDETTANIIYMSPAATH